MWFWSCPPHLKKVTTVPCKVQISCIFSKLHCFLKKVDLNSHCFTACKLKFQRSNVAGLVKNDHILCWHMLQVIFTTGQLHDLLKLIVKLPVVRWHESIVDGQHYEHIPHASWSHPVYTRQLFQFMEWAFLSVNKHPVLCCQNLFIGSYNDNDDLSLKMAFLNFTR